MKLRLTMVLMASLLLGRVAGAADCDRACLRRHLEGYLAAVVEHDPAAANLWVGFRQTENSIVIPAGEGVWRNVTALGSVQRRYLDPMRAQAGYFGTVLLGAEEAVVALRLKVGWEQVTEAEWFVARKSDPGVTGEPGKTPFDLERLRATLPAERIVPAGERMQREALQAIVNSYFDGITSHDGRIVKGHPGCSRYENGFPTFNSPLRAGMDIGNDGKSDCRTQADFGVAIVAGRDYFVIDEEAQAVMVSAVFRREAGNSKWRNHFTEVFHLDHGRIRDIHAAFYYAPDDRPVPNWSPYDGLFPLPATYR
ncbi:MAG: hypothetical protein IT494_00405 [Gammaproteobacteria bacterium]|nr:hypothetical protein [Gammaproteobacteria bacterium]